MFVPSAESLMIALKIDKSAFDGKGQVTIPAAFFKLLLQIALAESDFDEARYLRENPDVARAMKRGAIKSAHMHYVGFGYFEGRQGGGPVVDSEWYLNKYSDVASAVSDGRVESAESHFQSVGGGEGRSPGPEYEGDAALWKSAIQGTEP
ncbi:hypothetical protein [Rhodopseudomonas palustris]|uniref:Uncharacterized protein n=1 Tax=Rhodopseudomonas palustris TaxID=1076 RepID=A0A418VNM7_RHOPL|nr:hypothetical protein [Rhodopseudomonas palustris]RJF77784.1 hypothetical protein D4Q52_02425 [Rhodopseudomonas palustris]